MIWNLRTARRPSLNRHFSGWWDFVKCNWWERFHETSFWLWEGVFLTLDLHTKRFPHQRSSWKNNLQEHFTIPHIGKRQMRAIAAKFDFLNPWSVPGSSNLVNMWECDGMCPMILRSWQGNYGALELCTLPGVDGGGAKGLFQKSHAGLPNPLDNLILSIPWNVHHISIHIHQTFHKSREKHHTVQCFALRLPHDGFANVGGNEQGNTRAEAVALADSSDSSVCFITKNKTRGNLWVEALGHQHVKSSWSSSKPKTTNLRLPCLTYSISVPSATAHLTCSETGDLKCCQLPFGTRRCSKNLLQHSQAASPCIPNKSASDGSRNTGLRDTRMVSLTLRLKNIQFTFWANFNHSTNEIIVRKGTNLSILQRLENIIKFWFHDEFTESLPGR